MPGFWTTVVLAVALAWTPPLAAADTPIGFEGSSLLALTPTSPSATLQNNTNVSRFVDVKVELTSDDSVGVSFTSRRVRLDAASSKVLKLDVAAQDFDSVSGAFVAVDRTTGLVVRQSFTLGAKPATPSSDTIDQNFAVPPWSPSAGSGEFAPLPLDGDACPDELSTALQGPHEYATLTATCEGDELRLRVSDLGPFSAGEYKGTLDVGDTEVSVTLTRSASIVLFLVMLLLGIVTALAARSFTARRPRMKLRSDLKALGNRQLVAPEAWNKSDENVSAFLAAPSKTSAKLLEGTDSATIWGTRLRRFSWFLVQPSTATAAITERRKLHEAAVKTADAWNEAVGAMADLTVPGPPARTGRATALKQGQPVAFRPQGGGTARTDLAGVQTFLDEVDALKTDAESWSRLEKMTLASTPPAPDDEDLAAALAKVWVRCTVELTAIKATIQRAAATPLAAADLESRVNALELEADRLKGYPQRAHGDNRGSRLFTVGVDDFRAPAVNVELPPILTRTLHRVAQLVARSGRQTGDVLMVVLAVILVVLVGLSTLYLGKAWGTPWDMAGTFAAAAGGTIVLTPLLAALDQISEDKTTGST